MTDPYQPAQMIDTHQHLWKPSERRYEWLDAARALLNVDFGPEDGEADVAAAGITGTVLVQAADTYDDIYMASVASRVPVVRGVVGWVPLDRAAEAEAALDAYAKTAVRGLNTASGPELAWQDWLPYVDRAVDQLSSGRVMLGSDLPVSILAGDLGSVWLAKRQVIAHLDTDQQDDILYRSALRAYSLDLSGLDLP